MDQPLACAQRQSRPGAQPLPAPTCGPAAVQGAAMVQTRSGKEVKADPAGLKDTAQTREGGALPTTPPSTPLAAPGRRRRGATATHGEPH